MARPYPLPDRQQKRGCATVPVPREDVLVDGRVPKGCRFHPDKGNGTVLCTPTVAQKVGVLDVERKKPVPKPGEMSKRKYCYTPESPYPYRRDGELKQGCEEDEETGKICCSRSYFRKGSKKAAKTARETAPAKKKAPSKKAPAKKAFAKKASSKKVPSKKALAKKTSAKKKTTKKTSRRGQQSLPGVNGLDLGLDLRVFDAAPRPLADAGSGVFDAGAAPRAAASLVPEVVAAPGSVLALLDDGSSPPLVHDDPRALAMSDDLILRSELPADITAPRGHLESFGDFAMTYAVGSVLAAGGLAATYEVVDRIEWFDDKPVARAGAFVGMGVAPAALAWWLSQDSEYGAEIRTGAAAWGVAFTAVGILGLVRTLLEQQASQTEDPEQAKALEDAADHVPWYEPQDHTDDGTDTSGEDPVDGEDEVATDGADDTGTSGVPYPHSRFFR